MSVLQSFHNRIGKWHNTTASSVDLPVLKPKWSLEIWSCMSMKLIILSRKDFSNILLMIDKTIDTALNLYKRYKYWPGHKFELRLKQFWIFGWELLNNALEFFFRARWQSSGGCCTPSVGWGWLGPCSQAPEQEHLLKLQATLKASLTISL